MKRCVSIAATLLAASAVPFGAIVWAQGFCWGNCPSDAIQVVVPCFGVEIGGKCIENPTPEQRKEAEREKVEKERLATADRLERERKAADRKRKVDAQVIKMGGEHRRPEAERYVQMQEAAEAARPKPPPRQCTTRAFSHPLSDTLPTQAAAERSLQTLIARQSGCNITGSESVKSMTAGSISCHRHPGSKFLAESWTCSTTVQCVAERCGSGKPVGVSKQ